MAPPFCVQHRTPTGWKGLETPAEGRKRQQLLAFQRFADAEKLALELSAANEGKLFRVVREQQPMTGSYWVYMSGQKLVYDHETLILYPQDGADVAVLEALIAPAYERLTGDEREQARCIAAGALLARWAEGDHLRLARVFEAAQKG